MIPLKWIFNTYVHTLIGLLQDTSVAACGGLQSRAQPLHVSLPLAGYLDRRGKHPPVSPPHSPLPPSKYKFYFTPPSTIRTTPLQSFQSSHEVDLPTPLAFFPVSSSHEAFFLQCAVLIKLIPLPLKHSSFVLQEPSNWHHSVDTFNFPFHSFSHFSFHCDLKGTISCLFSHSFFHFFSR